MFNFNIGDKVQIKADAIDITNGIRNAKNSMFTKNKTSWATVANIVNNFNTGGQFGLPPTTTKVVLKDSKGNVIWQIQPSDIASNVIKTSLFNPNDILHNPLSNITQRGILDNIANIPLPSSISSIINTAQSIISALFGKVDIPNNVGGYTPGYATTADSEDWSTGIPTTEIVSGEGKDYNTQTYDTAVGNNYVNLDNKPTTYKPIGTGFRDLNAEELKSIGTKSIKIDASIAPEKYPVIWEDKDARRQLLSDDTPNHQNAHGFPYKLIAARGVNAAQYDYRIQIGDDRYPLMKKIEEGLTKARAVLGIPVHGQKSIARLMKYYLYNRFRVPDINLNLSRTFTYVFFTRPDLNLLYHRGGAVDQVNRHTEAAMLWRRNPELFKLLTDFSRCEGDTNNFNLLLSNQVLSFETNEETLKTTETNRSWASYNIPYGFAFDGRTSSEFTCSFRETCDFDIHNLIKLWMIYIDNVSRGEWKPSYNLFRKNKSEPEVAEPFIQETSLTGQHLALSHVYTKTLDYAASAYVFKCGEDGSNVLFWTKYYGIYPLSSGSREMSWTAEDGVAGPQRLSIRFAYAYKRDMSPITLLEFNKTANVVDKKDSEYEKAFDQGYCSRPFVGSPFLELHFQEPISENGHFSTNSSIRLKFRPHKRSLDIDDKVFFGSNLT